MDAGMEFSRYLPLILMIGGLGLAWLALRVVFKMARRMFMLGCLGIVVLGGLVYLAGSSLPGL